MSLTKKLSIFALVLLMLTSFILSAIHTKKSTLTHPSGFSKKIAAMSSSFLYTLNKSQLSEALKSDLLNSKELKGVRITDTETGEVFFSYYLEDGRPHYNASIPKEITALTYAISNITFNDRLIGTAEIYVSQPSFFDNQISLEEDFKFKIRFLLLLFGLLGVIMILLFVSLFKKSKSEQSILRFGKKRFSYAVISAMFAFSMVTIVGGWTILDYNKENIENQIQNTTSKILHTVFLETSVEGQNALILTGALAKSQALSRKLEELMLNSDLTSPQETMEVASLMVPNSVILDTAGSIILEKGIHGSRLVIDKSQDSSFFNALAKRHTNVVLSLYEDQPIFFYVMPILDRNFDVIAVYYIKVASMANQLFEAKDYYFGKTGEAILFSRNGKVLSDTRFDVSNEKLTVFGEHISYLSLFSKNNNLDKVRDYNGADSLVASTWYDDANFGIAIKLNHSDAFHDFYNLRDSISTIMLTMLLFSIPFTMFTLYVGRKSNEKVRASRHDIILRLGHAAEFKDNETANHIQRISMYCRAIGEKLPVSETWLKTLCDAAPMHDVGKIGIPDHILNKPGRLTQEEWEVMRQHPEFGAEIIGTHSDSRLLQMAREIALCHHEKWDGSGYPYGTKGKDIPLSARIVAVSDVFDALTQERVYKKAWAEADAIELIQQESGTHFDPEVVDAFLLAINEIKSIRESYSDVI